MKKALYVFFALFFFCSVQNANAQVEEVNYKQINRNLTQIETDLRSGKITIDDTVDYIKSLNKTQSNINDVKRQYEQDLNVVQKRIEALGEVPKEGEKEARDITLKRAEFSSQVSALKAKIAEAELIVAKIDEIDNLILVTRNKDLLGNILNKQDLLVQPETLWNTSLDFVSFVYEIIKSPVTWYQNINNQERVEVKDNLIYASIIMFVALCFGVYLSYFIRRRFGYRQSIEKPDYSQKVFAALSNSIAYGVIPAAILGGFLLWLKNMPIVYEGFFGLILNKSAVYLLYIFLSQAVVKVVFATNNSKWRLIEVDDEKANSLSHALLFSIIMIGFISYLETVATKTLATSEVVYFIKILSNAIKMFCIVLLSRKALYDTKALTDEELAQKEENFDDDIGELSASSKLSIIISFSSVGVFILSLFGYITLSEFIFNRFIISILIIGSFYIINKAIKVIFNRVLSFKFWTRTFRIGKRSLTKAGFWFGFIVTPIIFFITVLALLGAWGVSVDILLQNIKKFLTEFYIGGVRISIISILLGIVVFFASWAAFKAFRRSLSKGILTKIDMDEGVRGSLAAGLGFIGFIVSVVFAIAVMGGNLTNLALIAGALSFGIGLGLQNIVSNFVSGIIILFERPMKIGDWVNINGQEGIVKQINIRATEIETFDKSNIIIPNATILSSSLTNLTHHSKIGRAVIVVGVAYDSDIKQVREILLGIAKAHKKVLANPEPSVGFINFGKDSIDFELRCFTSDVTNRATIQNDVREEIMNKFREAGVEIPFSQQVIHDGDKIINDKRKPIKSSKLIK